MALTTTHVGSLPRPQSVVDQIFARENGDAVDARAFDAAMTEGVSEAVRKQVEAGITWVSDGEMSKISYATYVKDRYTGFGGDSRRNAPADLKKFPSFLDRIAKSGGTPKYARPNCIGPIERKQVTDLADDIARFKAALSQNGNPRGFMNAASPGVVALFLPNQYYSTQDEYLEALSNVLASEYKAITDAGFDLQVDCPDLALSRHMLFSDHSDEEFVKIIEGHVEALNAALSEVPKERVRLHVCWGNYEGPHVCDVDMDTILPTLMKAKATYLLFESSNPRHAHEWTVFKERASELPDDLVLVPGALDTTTNFVEHPELVRQRLQQYVDLVGRERVVAGTDCGFGTFAGFGAVDPDIAYAKLGSLAEGASRV